MAEELLKNVLQNKNLLFQFTEFQMFMGNGLKKITTQYLQHLQYISRSKKIKIFNSNTKIKLIYIDDLVELFLKECKFSNRNKIIKLKNDVSISPKKLVELFKYFKKERNWFGIQNFHPITLKKMYSSFLTYVPTNQYVYKLKKKKTQRIFY